MTSTPPRLGLPWNLGHYRDLNGAHPLVASYVHGNPGVRTVPAGSGRSVNTGDLRAVVHTIARQARLVSQPAAETLINWLNPAEQILLENHGEEIDAWFLHTAPLYAGTRPWILHFESFPTLFTPFMVTGRTAGVDPASNGAIDLVRSLLASPQCLAIFTHMRSSLEILRRTLDSRAITAKAHHVPLGVPQLPAARILAKFDDDDRVRILFTNSRHRHPTSFYLRGGHLLVKAFARARRRVPKLELTVLSSVPDDLTEHCRADELADVTWIDREVDDTELSQLLLRHHVFALPAVGLHSYSMLRALAHGCVPLLSDALGYEEYTTGIEDSVLQITGVRDAVYQPEPDGWISEDYSRAGALAASLTDQIAARLAAYADVRTLGAFAERNRVHCRRTFGVAASQRAFNELLRAA